MKPLLFTILLLLISKSVSIEYKPTPKQFDIYGYCIEIIKQYEGFESKEYELFGHKYIGYGHLIKKNENYNQISENEATQLLEKDFNAKIAEVENATNNLSINKIYVLAMLSYNIGFTKVSKSTLFKYVELNMPDFMIEKEYLKWHNINKKHSQKLLQRRIDEFWVWEIKS